MLKLDNQHTKNRTQLSGRALKCYIHRIIIVKVFIQIL